MTFERLAVVLAVIAVAVAVSRLQNRGAALRRRRRSFTDIPEGVVVFASRACERCEAIESLVSGIVGPDGYAVLWWDQVPDVFMANNIHRVPAVARVGEDGSGWIASGIPTSLRLRRWLAGP